MDVELNDLPIIDMELGARLIGSTLKEAREILDLLIKTLPIEMASINQYEAAQDHGKLLATVHKLHSGVAYCGTPRLKKLLFSLESALRLPPPYKYSHLLEQLNIETELLLEQYAKLH